MFLANRECLKAGEKRNKMTSRIANCGIYTDFQGPYWIETMITVLLPLTGNDFLSRFTILFFVRNLGLGRSLSNPDLYES